MKAPDAELQRLLRAAHNNGFAAGWTAAKARPNKVPHSRDAEFRDLSFEAFRAHVRSCPCEACQLSRSVLQNVKPLPVGDEPS